MMQGKTLLIVLVTLLVGFVAGFVLRPVIAPPHAVDIASPPSSTASARSTQYFVAHVDEARQIAQSCRDGSVRGDECSNAEAAIVKLEAQKRSKQFIGD